MALQTDALDDDHKYRFLAYGVDRTQRCVSRSSVRRGEWRQWRCGIRDALRATA